MMLESFKFSSSFNRPSDTNAYSANDAVNTNTSAGSVTLLSWDVQSQGDAIMRVKVRKSDQTVATPTIRVWFYDATLTPAAGDNAAFAHPAQDSLGYADVPVTSADSDDAVGWAPCNIPIGRIGKLYGQLQTLSAFTPASAETFTVEIWVGAASGLQASNDGATVSLALIDDTVQTDDAAFTPASGKVLMIGAEADETAADSVDEGDGGALRMTLARAMHVNLRNASGTENFPTALGGGGGVKTEIFDSAGTEISWSGITTVARLLSASGTTQDATNVKNGAGRIYSIDLYNAASAVRYLKLYNKATTPTVGTDTPIQTFRLSATTQYRWEWPIGLAFSTGIGYGLVTAQADNSTASVTAGDITDLNIAYT